MRYIVKNIETGQLSYQDIDINLINQVLELNLPLVIPEYGYNHIKPSEEEIAFFLNEEEQEQYLKNINIYKAQIKKDIDIFYKNFVKFNIINSVTISVDPLSDFQYKEALEIYHAFEIKKQVDDIDFATYVMKYKDPISGHYVEGKYAEILEIVNKILQARRYARNNADFHKRAIDNILVKDEADINIIYQATIDAVDVYDYQTTDELSNTLVAISGVYLSDH